MHHRSLHQTSVCSPIFYYDRKSIGRSGNIGVKLDPYTIDVGLSWDFFGIHFLILEIHGGLYERVGVTSFSLRSDPDTRVAFTNAAGELLEKVDLTTILPYFLTVRRIWFLLERSSSYYINKNCDPIFHLIYTHMQVKFLI